MSGLLLGILLARSLASVTAAAWGWRSIYLISAVAMIVLSAVLWRVLPAAPAGARRSGTAACCAPPSSLSVTSPSCAAGRWARR